MKREPKPTLKTLALETGLAVTTVSRALKGAPEIAKGTRDRVQRAAKAIGYVPDRAAQRLRTGRTNVISFLLEPHDEMLSFGTMMIAGIMESLENTSFHLVVTPQFEKSDPLGTVDNIIRNRLADGVIFCRTTPLDIRVRMLLEAYYPFICHGRTELATPHPFVDFDNFEFALDAAARLARQGCKKLALLNARQPFTFSQHLMHGFMTAVRESGVSHVLPENVSIDSAPEAVRDTAMTCIREQGVDGFVCAGESSAMAVIAAVSDCGLRVNEDIGMVAKQTTPLFGQIRPQIDTIYEDLTAAGRQLGTLLLRRIEGAPVSELQQLEHGEHRYRD